ncbi:hypothetical protein CYLTODRAFT_425195 [Cylindrobasidium torrendii FP15055 ss-10]|uniref:Uncharacterized protein n=1 Tax=Cylindrobasidium torrendii FP15055 ss-10 TaxID=1314674 RepID=A0A0D7B1D7_9AGAR|nr:hypothetical protein CYLTODRAFT_425195 [Cylindrobasidium torrendii FP15055 ss-10]
MIIHLYVDATFRLYLDTHLEEDLGFGQAVYVTRPDASYYDFLAVADEIPGAYETDNPIHDHLVTDKNHLVSGDTPSVDRMRAILDEMSERDTIHWIPVLLRGIDKQSFYCFPFGYFVTNIYISNVFRVLEVSELLHLQRRLGNGEARECLELTL